MLPVMPVMSAFFAMVVARIISRFPAARKLG
jgi:hypothetical protein